MPASLVPPFSMDFPLNIDLFIFLISASFMVFAIYSLYRVNRRRQERRHRDFVLPLQRRRAHRRKASLPARFAWAIRTHLSMFAKPKPTEEAKPKRKPGPRVEYLGGHC